MEKNLFDKVGPLDENLNFVMDYDLWLRIFKYNDKNKLHVPAVWSNYREWELSKSISQMKKFMEERKTLFKKYGGNKIDPYIIQRIITSRYFYFIKKLNTKIANILKRYIFYISDYFHYKIN